MAPQDAQGPPDVPEVQERILAHPEARESRAWAPEGRFQALGRGCHPKGAVACEGT